MNNTQPQMTGLAEESGQLQFQLAPLTTGQILDRTFVLYRARFGLFAGLAVFPAAAALLFGLLQLIYLLATHTPLNGSGNKAFSAAYITSTVGFGLVGGLARLCVYGISIAASACAKLCSTSPSRHGNCASSIRIFSLSQSPRLIS